MADMPKSTASQPLKGIRILDLTRLLPGPLGTLMLQDMGAEIWKVEDPMGGDYVRWLPPMVGEYGAAFLALNRGKRSIALNLKAEGAKEALLALIKACDVVVEGFRPGVMERLGVGYEAARAARGDVIWCSITGYGQEGPYRDKAGHDLNYMALAGGLGVWGARHGGPQHPGVQVADVAGGSLGAVSAILGALFHRERTGEGQFLDVSMTDGALSVGQLNLAGPLAGGVGEDGEDVAGSDQLGGSLPNYRVYQCQDGEFVALGALEPHFWKRFLKGVGQERWQDAPFGDREGRDACHDAMEGLFISQPRSHWAALGEEYDICLTPVLRPDEVAAHPLHQARGLFPVVDLGAEEGGKPARVQRTMAPFSRRDASAPKLAPALGADTEDILKAIGLEPLQIEALRASGAIL